MSSAYYELYLKGVLDLVGTMVVKSEVSAAAINDWLKANLYTVDEDHPTTWKYYLHLAGKYHHTDIQMTIKSLDTQEEIPFTVATMAEHRNTRREYTYRSRYYNELVGRFPEQEELILGILNPVDINQAIAAKDHTILYYDKTLVETNEIALIPQLQNWITAFYTRWNVPDYALVESLYPAAQTAILFGLMPKQIINLRLAACKTDNAHSFHIRQYLTSFGRLDPYVDYLNTKQRLFFYRNIRNINLNAGKTETFELLTERVLTDRRFPLAEYSIRHNSENQIEDLYPTVELRRTSINGLSSALGANVKTVDEVLELEGGLARANEETRLEAATVIPQLMKNSLSSKLQTKVLESNVLDSTDSEAFTLTDVIFNQWLFFGSTGRYNTVFNVTNPNTGEDLFLSTKEMFILWLYVYNKARDTRLDIIPNIVAKRVLRTPLPTVAELRGIVEKRYVPDEFIFAAVAAQPVVTSYISVDAFKEVCTSIHRASLTLRDLATYQPHYLTRGQVEQMTDRFYMDYEVNLGDESPYDEWLTARSLNLELLSPSELDILATTVYATATGQSIVTTKSLQDIHRAHVRLMGQLSSYSIQFIQQINTSSLKVEDWTYIRPGDRDSLAKEYIRVKLKPNGVVDLTARAKPGRFTTEAKLDLFKGELVPKAYAYRDVRLETVLHSAGAVGIKRRLPVIGTTILDPEVVDLSTVTPNEVPLAYTPITPITIQSMFETMVTDEYRPLTQWERNILLTRT